MQDDDVFMKRDDPSRSKPKFQTYVLGFLFHPDRHSVALIEKAKPFWQAGKLNGIGGKVEFEETSPDAMVREFQEETGVRIDSWERFAYMHGVDWMVHCYRAFDLRILDLQSKTEERVGVYSLDWDAFNRPLISNLHWLIPLALDRGTNDEGAPKMVEIRYFSP